MPPSAHCPVLLIGAPASGQGKTTVVAGLARLYSRQGLKVQVFKCGADFLDPFWHELASSQPVYPIDLWMTGEIDIRERLYHAAMNNDLILIEGVMGLFDGSPSAADLATQFNLPVVGIIEAAAMVGTFGAIAYGLQHYRPGLPWAGVIANKVASHGHGKMLETTIDSSQWLGHLCYDTKIALPERHLGLIPAAESTDSLARLDAIADALVQTHLGQLGKEGLQRFSVVIEYPADQPITPKLLAHQTIAVAKDSAFCFIYQGNIDALHRLGAQVVFFSPLAGEPLPPCDAIWLPGGYPELYAETIASLESLKTSLVEHVRLNKPIWAECGGMMVLFETLKQPDRQPVAMWGLLPGTVSLQTRLAGLGPQQLALSTGVLRGHTFHYSRVDTSLKSQTSTTAPNATKLSSVTEVVYQQGSIQASYFHAWFPSCDTATAELFLSKTH